MYSYNAEPASEDFTVDTVKIITHENLNIRGFKLAIESAIAKLTYPIKTQAEFEKISGKLKQSVDAVIRGVERILQGLPFTVYAGNDGMTGLVIQSSSRSHQYIVTENHCQCEGHANHGSCFHRSLYPVFQTYVGLVRAHEEFQRAHARLGIRLLTIEDQPRVVLFGGHSLDHLDAILSEPPSPKERGM